jgi:hypothetical protein
MYSASSAGVGKGGSAPGLSEITVKAHRGAVMRKVGASTLADLVLMVEALQLGNGEDEECLSC